MLTIVIQAACVLRPNRATPGEWTIPLALLSQYHVLLLDRSSDQTKSFVVNETDRTLREVDPYDWLEAVEGTYSSESVFDPRWGTATNAEHRGNSGDTGYAQRSPRAGPHSLCSTNGFDRRKRSIARHFNSHSPPHKRQKPRQNALATAQIDFEEHSSDSEDDSDDVLDGQKAITLQPQKVASLRAEYYIAAFELIGQLGCKYIGKMWIKLCHPRKQTTHPYNGGGTKHNSMNVHEFEGALTAPVYWPSQDGWRDGLGCRHKEPDHIKKAERLILLRHLLCCGHPNFSLEKLRLATVQVEREVPKPFTRRSINILKQIYDAREKEIRYENDEIDGDTVINVYMPKAPIKSRKAPKRNAPVAVPANCPQQDSLNPNATRASSTPTASMEANIGMGDDCPSTPRLDLNLEHKTTPIRSTRVAFSVSDHIAGAASSDSIQSSNRSSQAEILTPTLPPKRRNQKYLKRQPSNAQGLEQGDTHRGPQASTKRGSTTHGVASVFSSTREPQSYLGRIDSRVPSDNIRGTNIDYTAQQGYRHMGGAQCSHNIRDTHKSSTHPINPTRQTIVPTSTTFSGSSSGLAGLPPDESWPTTGDIWTSQRYGTNGPMLTEAADPGALFLSYPSDVTSSFGSDFTESSPRSGVQVRNQNELLQTYGLQNQQVLDAKFQQQCLTYLPSGFNTLSMESAHQDDSASFQTGLPRGLECEYIPNAQDRRHY